MSGHSKWTQIKRQKGVMDVKRGLTFTKLANAIVISVSQGGGIGDPQQNFKLRLAIEKAREVNMPKSNIERAIEKGMGKNDKGESLQEVIYEGFAPSGVSIIAEGITNNKQRTASEIKNTFDKNGGNLATSGAVSYQFPQKGVIIVKKIDKSFDDIFLLAIDAGALDVEEVGEEIFIYTEPDQLAKVRSNCAVVNLIVVSAQLSRIPLTVVLIEDASTAKKVLTLIEKLEDLDDILKVYANFDIPQEILSQKNF